MNRLHALLVTLVAGLLLSGGVVGTAMAQEDPPADPPAVVQLCTATDIEQVDALLKSVADTALIQSLSPLLTIDTNPDPDGVEVKAGVTLDQVREKLECPDNEQPGTSPSPKPSPVPTPTPEFATCNDVEAAGAAPLLKTQPGYRPELDIDGDGIACEDVEGAEGDNGGTANDQVSVVPNGPVDTGAL